MATFPKDQFDTLPEDLARQGAHRAPKKKGGGWVGFAWAALATGVLVVGGLYGLSLIDSTIRFEVPGITAGEEEVTTPSESATPEVPALTDPTTIDKARKISITVLNGTETAGLQTVAGDALKALKWPIGTRTTASLTDVEKTFVYYSNPADEDIARGLVLALGIGEIRESAAFIGAPLTIVLGDDYAATQ
ncbi:LytR family transcriptional regulator [Glaciihabitans arcticus]|uniref:LytR family transcriptional regulator n=1 Tax=Glaciihabitans arcticus TaxID=2668039 RepID=A0A4V2JF05_9MICO|nr:LytR C-terminal domain-containing protein [Glaciihabitans arcticus]TBN57599.1 LytR family transcriptional regulator [Glaciihabitans arcticus]